MFGVVVLQLRGKRCRLGPFEFDALSEETLRRELEEIRDRANGSNA